MSHHSHVRPHRGKRRHRVTRTEAFSGDAIASRKENQLAVITSLNPPHDDYHTWIRSVDDIHTFDEARYDEDDDMFPDFTQEDEEVASVTRRITVYSSHEIGNGCWVTPSRIEAESYAGNRGIHSANVDVDDIAWTDDISQGMYVAPIADEQ